MKISEPGREVTLVAALACIGPIPGDALHAPWADCISRWTKVTGGNPSGSGLPRLLGGAEAIGDSLRIALKRR